MTNITLKDIYEVTNRIEDKLDKVDSRVSLLEMWRAQIMGQLIILSGMVALGISFAVDWIKKKLNV
jgi:hypothetical protein